MGTNYYIRHGKKNCECCDSKIDNMLHIGKNSYGWEFSFQGYRELKLNSFSDWREFLDNSHEEIVDEYDCVVLREEFFSIVTRSKIMENKNHYLECVKDGMSYQDSCLDDEGYSISYTEFS